MKQNILIIVAALLLFSSQLLADLKPATHSGFYGGLGIGAGSLKMKADAAAGNIEINTDSETGITGNFRLGFAASNKVLIGLEVNSWGKEYEDRIGGVDVNWQLTVGSVAVVATYYPTQYFFLKGGPAAGVTTIEIELPDDNLRYDDNASGLGFIVGAGGELRVTKHFAIVPSIQWMWQKVAFDEFDNIETDASDVSASYFTFTVAAGWFW